MKIPTGTSACVALVSGRSEPKAPILPAPQAALPGTAPRPYHTHKLGECQFIIGEAPDMADALTCCAPVPEPAEGKRTPNYCAEHAKLTASKVQTINKRPATGNELIRSLRKFL